MTSSNTAKAVVLKGIPVRKEMVMTDGQAIIPGHLVTPVSAGTLSKNSSASAYAPKAFADIEDFSGGSLDVAYSNGETVAYGVCRAGDEINAILEDGHTVAVGDLLESAGDGTLQPQTAFSAGANDAGYVIGMALEAVVTSGSTARIKIEVL